MTHSFSLDCWAGFLIRAFALQGNPLTWGRTTVCLLGLGQDLH